MISRIIKFSNNPKDLKFSEKDLERINSQGDMAIITGESYTLTGWIDHECDCKLCNIEYEDIYNDFTSKEEAEKYIEDYDVNDPVIEKHGLFIKAVQQAPVDFGLFKELSV